MWTENDVYGLVEDGDRGFVIEGCYLEFASRMPVKAPAIHPEMTRESYFDRWLYGSGLLTWHFDYWRRSNVLLRRTTARNNDPNRMQMDVEEWDFNDNTQEIALNLNRAEAERRGVGRRHRHHVRHAPAEPERAATCPTAIRRPEIAIPSGPRHRR